MARTGNAKLTWDQACEVRRLKKQGASRGLLSEMFGITCLAVDNVVAFRTYKNPAGRAPHEVSRKTLIITMERNDDMTTQMKVSVNGNYHAEVTITSEAGASFNTTATIQGGKDGPTEQVFSLPHGKKTTFVVDERQMTPEEVIMRDKGNAPPVANNAPAADA